MLTPVHWTLLSLLGVLESLLVVMQKKKKSGHKLHILFGLFDWYKFIY